MVLVIAPPVLHISGNRSPALTIGCMIKVTEIPRFYRVEYDGLTGEQFDAAKEWLGNNGVAYETHEPDGYVSWICLVQADPDQRAAFEADVLGLTPPAVQ